MNLALRIARTAHHGQVRKFTGLPYLTHCQNVATIACTFEPDCYEVAMLHDTLEDTDTHYDLLAANFGYEVADDVVSLTNVSKEAGNRKHRKDLDNLRLAKASYIAQTVKLADILDNVPSMILHKPEFGMRYLDEKLETLRILNAANQDLFKIVRDYLSNLKRG